jgi:SAM-dependent methyltransferase
MDISPTPVSTAHLTFEPALVSTGAVVPAPMRLPDEVQQLLVCPVCRSGLRAAGRSLECCGSTCGTAFPLVHGAPILINEQRSIFDIATFVDEQPTFFKPIARWREAISRRLPSLSANVTARQNFIRLRKQLLADTERPRVLVVGGSVLGDGMECLAEDPRIELIESDAAIGPRTELICDAHDLPFRDASLDAVIVQAVLEHVVDPHRAVGEIHRVLREGGLVYADTPFMQQVHGREFDFTRYTRLGHRRLFRDFREIDSGITCGPGMALAWSAYYFALSFFANAALRAAVAGLCRLSLFWLKYFDYLLIRRETALDAASAFYFLGEKTDQVLSDRELAASYRGGF